MKPNSGTSKATSGELEGVIVMESSHKHIYAEKGKETPFLGTTLIEIPLNNDIVKEASEVSKDVCIILDTSGSMAGQKITKARMAVRKFRDSLGINDRLSVICFDEKCDLTTDQLLYNWFLPKVTHQVDFLDNILNIFKKKEQKPSLTNCLENANPNGSTAFQPAFVAAQEMFRRLPEIKDQFRRKIIILITDGDHNSGQNPKQICKDLLRDGITICALGVEQSSFGEELLQQLVGAACFFGIDKDKIEEAITDLNTSLGAGVISRAKVVIQFPKGSVLKDQTFSLAMVMVKNKRPFAIPIDENNEIYLGDLTCNTRLRIFYIGKIDTTVTHGVHPIIRVILKGQFYKFNDNEEIRKNELEVKIGQTSRNHQDADKLDVLANSAIALSHFNKCKQATSLDDLRTNSSEARRTAELDTTEFNQMLIQDIGKVESVAETNFIEAQNMSRELTTQTRIDCMNTGIIIRKVLEDAKKDASK